MAGASTRICREHETQQAGICLSSSYSAHPHSAPRFHATMADEKAPDKEQPAEKKPSALRKLLAFVCSRKMVPIVKGTLAFTITMAVILLRKFEDLAAFPPALASMIIVSLAGKFRSAMIPVSTLIRTARPQAMLAVPSVRFQ